MKALILAAGFGTRLLPHTQRRPKALFPIAGRPIIDIMIDQLARHGCSGVMINIHHLHDQMTAHLHSRNYPIPVFTRLEKEILGTGGAIKNVADFLTNGPFLVINSDILCDIDLRAVYEFHTRNRHPVTLVMHDYAMFNNVWIDAKDFVICFGQPPPSPATGSRCMAFTGIQVVDPVVLDFIPENMFISSIDVYKKMIQAGHQIKAYRSQGHYWRDIGSVESYQMAVIEKTAPQAYMKAFGKAPIGTMGMTQLAGDGSDRKWYRIFWDKNALIMADHGIQSDSTMSEIHSFLSIGRHLLNQHISVPEIYQADVFSGLVFLEDLGDTSLQTAVSGKPHAEILAIYQSVIDEFLRMAIQGAKSFDPSCAYQTPEYNRQLILERECQYFVEAFLIGYLHMDICFEDLALEFSHLADLALEYEVKGFMHRDLQSRNIMIKNHRVYFIDFQGGRLGPIQYDLASLLHDPYVNLPEQIKTALFDYCVNQLQTMMDIQTHPFAMGFRCCSVTRLLQALGAFGFLSRAKGKPYFESYIPLALHTLQNQFVFKEIQPLTQLKKTIDDAAIRLNALKTH